MCAADVFFLLVSSFSVKDKDKQSKLEASLFVAMLYEVRDERKGA